MKSSPKKRILAYGSIPKDGGTYTFFRNQREMFKQFGVEMYCVVLGKHEHSIMLPEHVVEGVISLLPEETDSKLLTIGFLNWCKEMGVDIVMAVNSIPMLNSIPYLPQHILVVTRAANAFDEGYHFATYSKERINHFIALTPRLKWDLESKYGIHPTQITVIPNGVKVEDYSNNRNLIESTNVFKPLKLIFVGRLEHNQKGVLYIPKIVNLLVQENIPFELSIVGKGRDEVELKKKLRPFIGKEVHFYGMLNRSEVISKLQQSDIYVFLSHFEGCPNSLLEAMVSGCVPVSWLIPGITDFIIEDKSTGFLSELKDCQHLVKSIKLLNEDRELLINMKQDIQFKSQIRFASTECVKKFVEVFENCEKNKGSFNKFSIQTMENYQPMPVFKPSLLKRFKTKLVKWKL